jgi:hypothetical protein
MQGSYPDRFTSQLPDLESLPYLYELFRSLCTQISSGPLMTLSVTYFCAFFIRDCTVTRCIRCATASHSSVVQVRQRPCRHLHLCSRIGHKEDIIIPCNPRQPLPVLECVGYTGLLHRYFCAFVLARLGQVSYGAGRSFVNWHRIQAQYAVKNRHLAGTH